MAFPQNRQSNRSLWFGSLPARDGAIHKLGGTANNGRTTLITVGSGVTLLIGFYSFYLSADIQGEGRIEVTNASDTLQYVIDGAWHLSGAPLPHGCCSPNPPLEVTPGFKVKLYSSAAGLVIRGYIEGWEV